MFLTFNNSLKQHYSVHTGRKNHTCRSWYNECVCAPVQLVKSEVTLNIYEADGEGLNHSECSIRVLERERKGEENVVVLMTQCLSLQQCEAKENNTVQYCS